MKLVVVSHKECWADKNSPSGYSTIGGFPKQMSAISEIFEKTLIIQLLYKNPACNGVMPITGKNIEISAIRAPHGENLRRKIALLFWFPRNISIIFRGIAKADVIHAPIPGDIGTIGMVFGILMRKRLLVRYCGNWYVQRTVAERFCKWFMEKFGSSENIMLATGGSDEPPSTKNPFIKWIFATSLSENEIKALKRTRAKNGLPQRLVIVSRQEKGKGTESLLRALPIIINKYPDVTLDVVGDGSALGYFKSLAQKMALKDKVRFYGNVNHAEVLKILCESDIFCFPTKSEGFPKAVLEALACGLPVITSKVSVLPYLMNKGCGLVMDEDSPDELAELILKILESNKLREKMSKRALEVAKAYTLERWRDDIGEILRNSWSS